MQLHQVASAPDAVAGVSRREVTYLQTWADAVHILHLSHSHSESCQT